MIRRFQLGLCLLVLVLLLPNASLAGDAMVPLIDLGLSTYLGFEGGLYPGGQTIPPATTRQPVAFAVRRFGRLMRMGHSSRREACHARYWDVEY